jgi:hypothetical protein
MIGAPSDDFGPLWGGPLIREPRSALPTAPMIRTRRNTWTSAAGTPRIPCLRTIAAADFLSRLVFLPARGETAAELSVLLVLAAGPRK